METLAEPRYKDFALLLECVSMSTDLSKKSGYAGAKVLIQDVEWVTINFVIEIKRDYDLYTVYSIL